MSFAPNSIPVPTDEVILARTKKFFEKAIETFTADKSVDEAAYNAEREQRDQELLAILDEGEIYLSAAFNSGLVLKVSSSTYTHLNPLAVALILELPEVIRKIVGLGADINETYANDKTLPIIMVENNKISSLEMLIEFKADLNLKDIHGKTALMYAAEKGDLAMVKLLLDNGARIDERDKNDESALIYAIRGGHVDVVDYLIERGAQVNDRFGDNRVTPLIICTKGLSQWNLPEIMVNNLSAILRLLVKRGADIEARDLSNRTAALVDDLDIISGLGGNILVEANDELENLKPFREEAKKYYERYLKGEVKLEGKEQIYKVVSSTSVAPSSSKEEVDYFDNLRKAVCSTLWNNNARITENFLRSILESMCNEDGTITEHQMEDLLDLRFKQQKHQSRYRRPDQQTRDVR